MDINKLPKWKKFLKWVHECDGGAITIKDAIDAGVAKDAKDFHNLLYILKQKDLIDVSKNHGVYHIYTNDDEVEETLGGYYIWDDKIGLYFVFNDEDGENDPIAEDDSLKEIISSKDKTIDALTSKVGELEDKLKLAENNAEKLRVKLQVADTANKYLQENVDYLQENVDKYRSEVEQLKKQYACIGDIDANLKAAYKNVAKVFTILGNTIC